MKLNAIMQSAPEVMSKLGKASLGIASDLNFAQKALLVGGLGMAASIFNLLKKDDVKGVNNQDSTLGTDNSNGIDPKIAALLAESNSILAEGNAVLQSSEKILKDSENNNLKEMNMDDVSNF